MKFAAFEGHDKRPIYVNPNRVTYVKEVNERACLVYFGNEDAVEITMQASLVVEDLQRAASGK
jgi:competence transcription factor ComK